MQVLGGFSLYYGEGDDVCGSVRNMRHLAGADVHLRAVGPRLQTASVRHRPLRVCRVSRRLAVTVDVSRVHRRRRVPHVLLTAARLHRRLLRAHRRPGLASSCRSSVCPVACGGQHPPVQDSPTAHARHHRCVVRSIVAAALRHQPATNVRRAAGLGQSGEAPD